jgi:polyphosphate kinase
LFYFRQDADEQLLLSSADWMNRNMMRRVELAWPITNPVQRQQLVDECLVAYMHDSVDAWDLQPSGAYIRHQALSSNKRHGAQAALMRRYGEQAKLRKR